MSKYCPIVGKKVVYLTCQECDDRVCEKPEINILPKRQSVVEKKDTHNAEQEKCKDRGENPSCESCCNMIKQTNETMFGSTKMITYCKVFNNYLIDSDKVSIDGCQYHNKDLSGERICMNCGNFLGGGDWGLACSADYHKLPTALTEACDKFKK